MVAARVNDTFASRCAEWAAVHDRGWSWRSLRWPLLLLAIALLGIATAIVLDQTSAREYALVIGAPSLTVLLPISLVWLAAAAIVRVLRR